MRFPVAPVALLVLTAACAAGASAQAFSDGFDFYLPPEDSATVAYLPAFPVDPITDKDFISAQGHRFIRNGEPIRFFGGNLVADGAFPTPTESNFIAPRMRKMGFNLVRFHHLDNSWSPNRNIFANGSTRELDPDMLRRLEYLIFKLKSEGIFVNMNLHVSRTFTEADGVAGADSIVDFGKGVTLFDPYLIELQKEYATQLLTHLNPYTGRALVDDPVLAMVEITNENSLYFMWRNGSLRGFDDGGVLIGRHVALLDALWHDWLRVRYGSTEALADAWSADAVAQGDDAIVNGGFEGGVTNPWQLEFHGGASASVTASSSAPHSGSRSARVSVTALGTEDWRVQFKQVGLSVERDSTYTVRFSLRAEQNRAIPVAIQKNVDPWTVYASYTAAVTTDWQTFEFTFTAPETVDGTLRLSFTAGGALGSLWVDDVSMRRAGREGLGSDESLESGTVTRTEFSDLLKYSPVRLRDMTAFYIDLQNRYYDEMAEFLRDDLGVRVPMTGTNWNFGLVDLAVQSRLDYVDNHSYWDHPSFPNEPWSSTDWTIGNTPMVEQADGGTIGRLMAGIAPSDKPYTISEYNHAFPNRYQTEGVLMLPAYAAFHDVDGLMYFDYNGGGDWTSDRIGSYFSLHRNPAMMALMPSMAHAYRRRLIAEAGSSLTAEYGLQDILEYPANGGATWEGMSLIPRQLALEHRVVTADYAAPGGTNVATFPPAPVPPYRSSTREIVWDPDGLMTVGATGFVGVTGRLDAVANHEISDVVMLADADAFGTVTWTKLDGTSLWQDGRSLITVSSMAQNTGMGWDGTRTIHNNWGSAPTQMRPIRVTLRLSGPVIPEANAPYAMVHALDETGRATSTRRVDFGPEGIELVLDQRVEPTVWFGVELVTGTSTGQNADPPPFSLEPVYPNPAESTARVAVTLPSAENAKVEVFDLLGRRFVTRNLEAVPGRQSLDLDVADWAAGVYQVRIQSGSRVASRPLVVQ